MALGFMRRHRRWLFVFLWLVIAAFIILYIPAFQGVNAGSPGETLAKVGGLAITVGEYQRSYLRQRQAYERMYAGRVDPEMLRSLGLERQVFEALVSERVVELEARRLGLRVSDEELAREIRNAPQFQRDGRFVGGAEIRRLLELQGLTVEEFEAAVRSQSLRRKLELLVASGVSVTPAEVEREFRRRNERAKVEYVLVDSARFRPQLQVTDGELATRFEAKPESYRIPERRVVSYLLLDREALKSKLAVTDRELEADYQERREEFKQDEQVCASHILVKAKPAAGEAEGHPEAEARKLAEGLLEQLRQGADFAALARKASEDKGSAASGGDLGCFARGRMLPEFENAAFSLPAGETSELVKTGYGYHIIRVAEHREEQIPPLAQVKDRIRERLLAERVRRLAEDKAATVSEALRRGATLEAAAREQGLAAAKSAPFAKGEVVSPLGSPSLVSRAFSLKPGQVEPDAFALPQGYAFIALSEVQPPRVPALDEVKERVRSDLLEERARERARAAAAEIRTKAQRLGLEKAAAAAGLVRKETPAPANRGQSLGELGASAALDAAAYGLPEKALSAPIPLAQGYALLRVLERTGFDAQAFERQRDALLAALRVQKRGELFEAYLEQARARFPLERRTDVFRRVVG